MMAVMGAAKKTRSTNGNVRKGTKFLSPASGPLAEGTEVKYVAEDSGVVYLSYEADGNELKNDAVMRVKQTRYISVPTSDFDAYERPS